jgi:hypothetical protein
MDAIISIALTNSDDDELMLNDMMRAMSLIIEGEHRHCSCFHCAMTIRF